MKYSFFPHRSQSAGKSEDNESRQIRYETASQIQALNVHTYCMLYVLALKNTT